MVTKKSLSFSELYEEVYEKENLFGIEKKLSQNPLKNKGRRVNSVAVVGGMLGDEGKGRVADELTADLLKQHQEAWHYRDNGGANAGHTVEVGKIKIALHQLGAGVLQKGCTAVLGKGMVLHPEDLILELEEAKQALGKELPSQLLIDEMAVLCLDTHRAFEAVLKMESKGSGGATGRGIAPAYADIIYRHPLRMRDLASKNWREKITKHYNFYTKLISGFGHSLAELSTPRLDGSIIKVGTLSNLVDRLKVARKKLLPSIVSVHEKLKNTWDAETPIIFEKAQALGLDKRWGVYPDVTASNCGFDGIFSSTEGVVDHQKISAKVATIKATYSSSVGSRKLPTEMNKALAERIRKDANEYGATTKRPRDIAYLDLPMLSFLNRVGGVEYLAITHMDISYLSEPIKVCVGYKKKNSKKTNELLDYRPDQQYLNTVEPIFIELPPWDGKAITDVKRINELPKEALQFLTFITQALGVKLLMITVGPKRKQTVRWW